ncbi:dihydrofolate reductase [Chakrabartyella piscis]|uniref:dihydrofolate reductase n=1 Tax=Chakrabartyella piscis TaxID=2918914 RepID=UPI0029584E3D|nr:dihydrofolate reductase [Chakrabartyella piscis]
MDLIVAVDANWGIGRDGDLLRPIKGDLKRFREMTTGNVLVLGRKTLESFPNKKPLPKREHIVLTQNKDYVAEGVTLCYGLEELPEVLSKFADETIFVIGGGSIYKQLLPHCKRAYITKIQAAYPADTHFPNLDVDANWSVVDTGKVLEEDGVLYAFVCYENQDVQSF